MQDPQDTRSTAAKRLGPFMLRACLTGLALGLAGIGLVENSQRFSDPASLRTAQASSSALELPETDAVPGAAAAPRGDRLN
ncbi:MAG: hypothetical protein AAF739_02330 [Pseudomonadota bacterium]